MTQPFRLFRRTQDPRTRVQLVSRELIRAAKIVEEHERLGGMRTIGRRRYGGNSSMLDLRPWAGWARITGAPVGAAYPWVQLYSMGGASAQQTEGRVGTTAVLPAYEINGNKAVPVGAVVYVWIDADHLSYSFFWPGLGAAPAVQRPASFSTSQNNLNLAAGDLWMLSSSAPVNITGVVAGPVGTVKTLVNDGSSPITLVFQSTSSDAANRFYTSTQTSYTIQPCASVEIVYGKQTDTRWGIVTGPMPGSSVPLRPAQITTNQAGFAPGTATTVSITTDASRNLFGIVPGSDGQLLEIINTGSNPLVLVNESVSATAPEYRILTPLGTDVTLSAKQGVQLFYDAISARWRVVSGTGSNIFAGPVGGSGTTNAIPKWTAATTLGDSALTDDGTTAAITGRAVTIDNQVSGVARVRSVSTTPLTVERYGNDSSGLTVGIAKSRHSTLGSHTVVQSGDILGRVQWQGSDGSAFQPAAEIRTEVDGTPGATDMPGRLIFFVTPDGSATPAEAMRIAQNKTVTLAVALPAGSGGTGATSLGYGLEVSSNALRVTLTSSSNVLSSTYSLTQSNGTWESLTSMSATLVAGTWLVNVYASAELLFSAGSRGTIRVRLRNTTDSTDVVTIVPIDWYTVNVAAAGSAAATVILTLAASKTLELQAQRDTATTWTASNVFGGGPTGWSAARINP